MENIRKINENIYYLGCNDRRIELFENVYPVPCGMSYNNYLIDDEKTCLMDGVDESVSRQFSENLEAVLNGRNLDYFVVQHMEPDHCSSIPLLVSKYPEMKIVASAQAFKMMENFFHVDLTNRSITIQEGDTLSLGSHELHFISAPMVHWPEVMMSYESKTGTLFSADAFGSFGALSGNIFADEVEWESEWKDEARRYYVNIVGKYGPQTMNVLKKASSLKINMICPLHAHIWRNNFETILSCYQKWASYQPERNSVAIFYGSIYGNTENAAEILARKLAEENLTDIMLFDASKTDTSELVSRAFQYKTLVFASATYNGEIFDSIQYLITELKNHNLSNRKIALIENGSWAPMAGNKMKAQLSTLKNTEIIEPIIKITSGVSKENVTEIEQLAKQLAQITLG